MKSVSSKYDFIVRWQPFLLRPDMPPEGAIKALVTPQNTGVNPHLKQAGAKVNIDFTGKCDRYPNTLAGHAFLEYCKEKDDGRIQNDVAEDIFHAYFTDGLCPDENVLVGIASKHGLDTEEVRECVRNPQKIAAAKKAALEWSAKGVTGVPCFYMNGYQTFSGAQDVDSFVKIFDKVAEKFPLK